VLVYTISAPWSTFICSSQGSGKRRAIWCTLSPPPSLPSLTSAPYSTFTYGSQGSGKSHTLSCLLENVLISSSPTRALSSPLVGLVIHYDKFTTFSSI
jgi:pantothenate kinase-related protein Tda10